MNIMKIFVFALMTLFLAACSKYEEGGPSLASKKSRLVNDWKTVSITSNGVDITSLNLVTEVIIRNNNTITVVNETWGFPIEANGGWVFDGKKDNVLVTNNDGSLDTYEIVMLQKDESKFRRTDANGATILYHFVTK